jgi:hypothetical protein
LEAWGTKANKPNFGMREVHCLAVPPQAARPINKPLSEHVCGLALVPQGSKKQLGQKTLRDLYEFRASGRVLLVFLVCEPVASSSKACNKNEGE